MKGYRMQEQKNIIDCYNSTALEYAAKFMGELDKKHLDQILLKSFALENSGKGKLVDLGCGPGQTTKFLSGCGVKDLLGVDISPEMVRVAKKLNPHLDFETADMLELKFPDSTFGSAIAFYSIVHFDYGQIKTSFREINRVLIQKGEFLFSFHAGEQVVHLDDFLEHKVNIDFYFFDPDKITSLLAETGFDIIDVIERDPYQDVEHPSQRAYIWARSKG